MTDEQGNLEWEELRLQIEQKAKEIGDIVNILERRRQKLKEINDTNKAVENKRKENLISDLQSKNWYVNMREFMYPKVEVVDDEIVTINGVKYQRVEKPKPQTLFQHLNSFGIVGAEGICNIVRGWLIDNTVIETEDAEKVTFTIHKEQLQTPK